MSTQATATPFGSQLGSSLARAFGVQTEYRGLGGSRHYIAAVHGRLLRDVRGKLRKFSTREAAEQAAIAEARKQ